MKADIQPILSVRDLKVHFPVKKGVFKRTAGHVRAVDGVGFDLYPGQTLGLVGESGCGKTTVAKALVKLVKATGGSVRLNGEDMLTLSGKRLREQRRRIQMIFQDPFSSLDPKMTVGQIIGEAVAFHRPGTDVQASVMEYMKITGLRTEVYNRYPHEFSGGQRQRIGIARALATEPEIVIADEPVSALDVSVQAKVLNLMKQLQRDLGIAYLFITHDLSVVRHVSDRIAVMYLGNVVELFDAREIRTGTVHPYTRALISSIPARVPGQTTRKIALEGEIPSPINAPDGCKFQTRCPHKTDLCVRERPGLDPVAGDPDHLVACHHWRNIKESR